ncbi:putative UPF0481 protein At3g02645 [Diospyros lotus]|uniref:putative UPF0481 protein At3g02645 n=1 Tax=Diospyros lotus TaxID=55363 RepID=UPI0022556F04|nr:putative UPF0481 protein At3g02645 [Diospyros lotus]
MAKAPDQSNNSSGHRENAFILRIKEIVREGEGLVNDAKIPVSIFRVPKYLSAMKPVAYEPQLMGLGPFHHCRPEFVGMERYKLAVISKPSKLFGHLGEFEQLVKKLSDRQIKHRARLSYYNYSDDIDNETLVWIMAIDGMFLLEFLSNYVPVNGINPNATLTAHLVDYSGNKLAHHSIITGIMMLENQIPMSVLKDILLIRCLSDDDDDEQLNQKWATGLIKFCKIVAPLKLPKNPLSPYNLVFHSHHLLDLLYHLALPSLNPSNNQEPANIESASDSSSDHEGTTGGCQRPRPPNVGKNVQFFIRLWEAIVNLNIGWVRNVTKPMKAMAGVPCNVLVEIAPKNLKSSIPGLETSGDEEDNRPLVDEILIPSVSELIDAGVEFEPADDISSIRFDKETRTFYLPVLKLDVNSEVIIRNMIAYEAATVLDSLVFARFSEMINGIIDTAQDAIRLREKGIVLNSLKSDQDVADLFNGPCKHIRLSHSDSIDKAIKEVNHYYNNTRRVGVYNFMRKHVYESWRFLSVVAAVLLFSLTAIESVCSVYGCFRAAKS